MENPTLPDNFKSALRDFCIDLSITFPEYSHLWAKWIAPDVPVEEIKCVYGHCITIYPERFFDILYQNNDIFNPDNEIDTHFLPGVEFKFLYNCEGVTESTKKTMWKYLQLILFSVIGNVKNKATFGDTMNMFEGIDEGELNTKLNETMAGLTDFFKNISENVGDEQNSGPHDSESAENNAHSHSNGQGDADGDGDADGEGENPFTRSDFKKMFENMPNMDNIQDHLKTLFDGKIGSLAKEMAAELTDDLGSMLGEDMSGMKSTDEVLKKLMSNPKKIMDMMKLVGNKLDKKMNSGDISKDDILKEASELMSKMKDMGGTAQFNEIFKNLTKGMGLGKNAKMDTNALNRMSKQHSTRERLLKKMEAKKQLQEEQLKKMLAANAGAYTINQTASPNNYVFKIPGQEDQPKSMKPPSSSVSTKDVQDSYIHPDILAEMNAPSEKPKNKPKKKKSKK
uniref:Uncharacterized protein n=1 Tax=viral metagenome TaxID=1070528 RepID=A0A6C0DQ83_9ZZZZ